MIVSDVGRTTSGSSSWLAGSGTSLPSLATSRWWVTTAHSLAKPSTCSASFSRNDSGMNSGKYALTWPVSLNMPSRTRCMFSHSA
jgi:hypothetical protein